MDESNEGNACLLVFRGDIRDSQSSSKLLRFGLPQWLHDDVTSAGFWGQLFCIPRFHGSSDMLGGYVSS